ncbi:hypothetical protein HAX54_000887, partial [Datura stramonium]|nr:hypothetical protein [Datura stramonium]
MYYNFCDECSGYDDSNTSQIYDESHKICDLSKTNNICDEYYSDEFSDYDEISYSDECAYVGVGSVSPIKCTLVRSSFGRSSRRGHELTRVNK